ncbi:DUF4911 domain-containing protein [Thermotoga sp.]|uniref:DUF4911 domain-containing protein n=1 Tax=Thermotoga sp. TaxID=28240 RepID=UPI0025E6B24E|nr:DUF4911 domain-containing protein [Thermotoga sp.]MCD6551497.1 DUF4911 domain-containing protein [Thermotoga sp.]
MEYDIYVKVSKEDVHLLNYLLEVEEHMFNIRKYEDGVLRIITPFPKEAIELLEGCKEMVELEIVDVRENPGEA